jgi:hypothetical protein
MQAEPVIAVLIVVAFVAVCVLAPRHGADSRFIDRPGRQI